MLRSGFSRAKKIFKFQIRGLSAGTFVQNKNSIAIATKPPSVTVFVDVKFPLNRHRLLHGAKRRRPLLVPNFHVRTIPKRPCARWPRLVIGPTRRIKTAFLPDHARENSSGRSSDCRRLDHQAHRLAVLDAVPVQVQPIWLIAAECRWQPSAAGEGISGIVGAFVYPYRDPAAGDFSDAKVL